MIVADLLSYSLKIAGVLGVGQSALPEDMEDAETALKLMAGQWQRKRWLVYRLDSFSHRVQTWKATYTIGPGAEIDRVRPGVIESSFLRQLTGSHWSSFPVDYPLRQITSREEWNAIPLKNLGSWPAQWFYDPTRPWGTYLIWPVPIQTFFELHFTAVQPINDVQLDQEILDILPDEAEEALVYNLAARLRANYALQPRPDVGQLAQASLNTLRTMNFKMRPSRMPAPLRPQRRWRNPLGGFVPETTVSVPFPVLQ